MKLIHWILVPLGTVTFTLACLTLLLWYFNEDNKQHTNDILNQITTIEKEVKVPVSIGPATGVFITDTMRQGQLR